MSGGIILDEIVMNLVNKDNEKFPVYIDVYDSPLSRKWLTALNQLLTDNYHLEKNFCFLGFSDSPRNGQLIIDEINRSIEHINNSTVGYNIDDHYTLENSISSGEIGDRLPGARLIHEHYNKLHRYFEDLQGTSGDGGQMSSYYNSADNETRWHIRQLNLLCHEFESWALSKRKQAYLPKWQRPSQLMCWMSAPRFELDENDYDLFGVETLNRSLGGLYVGVNKAVGKHHYEVFQDEGKKYGRNIDELTTSTLRSQSQAAGDFDIEWAVNPGEYDFMKRELLDFRQWLVENNFDPDDKSLTIGHPKVGQVDLLKSFGSEDYDVIWQVLDSNLNVGNIKTSDAYAEFPYNWDDDNYIEQQIRSVR
jgi:hypothetical protein